jgi:hypothetical protein
MAKKSKATDIVDPVEWKSAVQARLNDHGISRYAFIRKCEGMGICTVHTGECLLADNDTNTGRRVPSFQTAINIARAAGFDVVLIPTNRAPGTLP